MTQTWQALGWTLLHFLWQGAALFLLYWIADRLCARRGSAVRYALALTALLAMPAAAIATLAYEEGAATQPANQTTGHLVAQATTGFSSNVLSLAPWDPTSAPAAMPASMRAVFQAALPWLDALWLAGVFFFSLRALGGWWLLRRLRLYTLEQAPHTLRLHLDVLRRQMGIGRMIDLRLSRRIINPLTAGVLKPWILLPVTALTALSPDQLEVVLAHELAHIRRADYFWNLLQTVVETLFFFHPAVWYVSRRVRQEREFCCDDAVVARCSDPSIYASALVRLEEERNAGLRFAMALDGNSRSGLRARILRILGHAGDEGRAFRPVSITAICVGVLLFLCPLPRVFASFREAPQAAAKVLVPVEQHVRPLLVKAIAPPDQVEPAPEPRAPGAVRPEPAPKAKPSPSLIAQAAPEPPQSNPPAQSTGHSDYIDRMRAAGYDVELDKYVAMKVQGITPEYAAEMNKLFGEKLPANCLIAMKIQGVTPDYVQSMRSAGYNVSSDKFIGMRIQGVTPEYAAQMAKLGFGTPTANELMSLKIQGVRPEDAQKFQQMGVDVHGFQSLITARIFNITPEFIEQMKAAGFDHIPSQKIVALRVQGVDPDFAKSVKAQFPGATVDDLIQMRIFHIDDKFIASAKQHGFNDLSIHKLVQLRISGIMDEADDTRK